jgi:hypothetical protein
MTTRLTASAIGRLRWRHANGRWFVTYPERKSYKVTGEGKTQTEAYNDLVHIMKTKVPPEDRPYLFNKKYT